MPATPGWISVRDRRISAVGSSRKRLVRSSFLPQGLESLQVLSRLLSLLLFGIALRPAVRGRRPSGRRVGLGALPLISGRGLFPHRQEPLSDQLDQVPLPQGAIELRCGLGDELPLQDARLRKLPSSWCHRSLRIPWRPRPAPPPMSPAIAHAEAIDTGPVCAELALLSPVESGRGREKPFGSIRTITGYGRPAAYNRGVSSATPPLPHAARLR
jgi:hypothetical protein